MSEIHLRHRRIPSDEVTLLWHDRFWDGPWSGLCLYRGSKYYFRCFDETEDGPWYRRFALYELTAEQLSAEEAWHELFRRKVGTHWEPGGALRPQELHHEFYDAYRTWQQPDYESVCPILGWFEH